MAKDRRVYSSTFKRAATAPYACSLRNANRNNSKSRSPPVGHENECEEVRCPICMEHPHNAVLLICSSRDKGCRPFICDTSYRHSNCLDQFRKSSASASSHGQQSELVCPLCRGQITGSVVEEPARRFMNSKTRCCSLETCEFSGNYAELRKHARLAHPSNRPSVPSAIRQSTWVLLEQQRDMDDALAHQMDLENDWAGWPNWDELGDADFWSDGSFFNFLMEEMAEIEDFSFMEMPPIENQMIQWSPLPHAALFSASLEWEINSYLTTSEWLHRSTNPTTRSNNLGGATSIASPTSRIRRENNPAISGLRSSSHRENSSSRSSHRPENNPVLSGSRSSSHGENSSLRSSRRSSFHREN